MAIEAKNGANITLDENAQMRAKGEAEVFLDKNALIKSHDKAEALFEATKVTMTSGDATAGPGIGRRGGCP